MMGLYRSSGSLLMAALSAGLIAAPLAGQAAVPNRDPEAARLITSDIPNFWRVFDRASLIDAGDLFQRDYIDAGSPGLKDFLRGRILNGRALAATVAARPRYYAAIRRNTLAFDTAVLVKDSIRIAFRRLKDVYPEAVFPDVYFVVGRLNSGGTVSASGLLLGIEMNARDEQTPDDELSAWEKAVTGRISNLPHIVAHELAHIQQLQDTSRKTLLRTALNEGGADFIAELISGAHINPVQRMYGDAHEAELWAEFQKEMHGTDNSNWLFQGDRATGRPADLGYYMGYRICKSFYDRAADKRAAVHRIFHITDPDQFLRESGYSPGPRPPDRPSH
jgi:hypothetical protein